MSRRQPAPPGMIMLCGGPGGGIGGIGVNRLVAPLWPICISPEHRIIRSQSCIRSGRLVYTVAGSGSVRTPAPSNTCRSAGPRTSRSTVPPSCRTSGKSARQIAA